MTSVFVVICGNSYEITVWAAYLTRSEAEAEVERLNEANANLAYYVERQLPRSAKWEELSSA